MEQDAGVLKTLQQAESNYAIANAQVYAHHTYYVPRFLLGHLRHTSVLWFLLQR